MLVTLYVSACATATREHPEPAPTTTPAPAMTPLPTETAPLAPDEPVISVVPPLSIDTTTLPPSAVPLPPPDKFAPHIALILPLKSTSASLILSASAVQQGFLTAANSLLREYPVRVYSSVDEGRDVIEHYRQAIANGALAVAGPLTRQGATQLAAYSDISVPTLALNFPEQKSASNKLYFFGLVPETEARQVAQLAFAAKLRDATIINSGTALSKRLAAAFAEEWKKLGGNITAEVLYKEGGDTSVLTNLPTAPWLVAPVLNYTTVITESGEVTTVAPKRIGPAPVAPGNVAFLAIDNYLARLTRPYLNPTLPVYATSQVFNFQSDTLTNYDLNEIRFVDMPWLLQPDHAAVMVYPRPGTQLDTEKERLYAYGIDAYRLLHILINNKLRTLPLDGVTGRIQLFDTKLFQREAVPALYKYGRGLTPDALAAIEAERAAAKAAENSARKAAENSNAQPAQ